MWLRSSINLKASEKIIVLKLLNEDFAHTGVTESENMQNIQHYSTINKTTYMTRLHLIKFQPICCSFITLIKFNDHSLKS